MAVVSRIATLVVSGVTGSRTWVATAATQDTAAGGSVVVTVTVATTGLTPPAVADSLELECRIDNGGTSVRLFALTPGLASQTATFHFTANGAAGGGDRCGTIRLRIRAVKTTGGPTNTYDVNSDTGGTPPTTFAVTQTDQGWIRGTTTATPATSNVGYGGALPAPYAYDDSIFFRLTLGATPFASAPVTLRVGSVLSQSVSDADSVFEHTFAGVCDERFAAASTTHACDGAPGNAALTGLAWTVLAQTAQTATVDPRLTATHLFQLDDNSYGAPPLSKNVASGLRLASSQAFLATRFTNARAEGVNGVTHSMTLTPVKPGTPSSASGVASSTQGGQAGWSATFLAWSSALPGGTWNKAVAITAPADIDDPAYLVGGAAAYTLVASNPAYLVRTYLTNLTNDARHAQAGDTLRQTAWVLDTSTAVRLTADVGTVTCFVVRYNGTTGRLEYLISDTDNTAAAWTPWDAASTIPSYAMAVSGLDARLYEKTFAATAGWGLIDVIVGVAMKIDGAPYAGFMDREILSPANGHDANAFDPTGLFK